MSRGGKVGMGIMDSRTELGRFIRARRLALGLCQKEVAERVGVSQNYVSALEVGVTSSFHPRHTAGLAVVFQCDPVELDALNPSPRRLKKARTELGQLIYSRREALGLSRVELAERMDRTVSRIRDDIEYSPGVSLRVAKKLAGALEMDISVFTPFMRAHCTRETQSEFGRFIRSRRIERGLTQADLAKRLGVSHQYVSGQLELRRSCFATSDTIQKLARALEVDTALLDAFRLERKPKREKENRERRLTKGKSKSKRESLDLLGFTIYSRRFELRLTQRTLAERAKTSPSLISALERGKGQHRHHDDVLERIGKALECEIPVMINPHLTKKERRLMDKRLEEALFGITSSKKVIRWTP